MRRSLGRALGPPRHGAWSLETSPTATIVRLDEGFASTAYELLLDIAIDAGLTVWDADAHELVLPFPEELPDERLAEALASLSSSGDGAWVVCEGGPGLSYYVQFFALGGGRARLEAVAGRHIPSEHALPSTLYANLALHGLSHAAESSPNLSCLVDLSGPRDRQRAAGRARRILEDIYGVLLQPPTRMRLFQPA
ncbi:MAG: hypothetical protein ACFCGT_03470 [Sandaracinaceae bacterium]